MTTPITKTIPTRDRWIDNTFQYPVALAQQTFRTNVILATSFLMSIFGSFFFIPIMLVALFFMTRLFLAYRHFKKANNPLRTEKTKAIKRLIPIYSIGLTILIGTGCILGAGSLLWQPFGDGAAVCALLSMTWLFLGLFLGSYFYPELYTQNTKRIYKGMSMTDPKNVNGLTNPDSPNYVGYKPNLMKFH